MTLRQLLITFAILMILVAGVFEWNYVARSNMSAHHVALLMEWLAFVAFVVSAAV